MGSGVFLSPDETAVATSARDFGQNFTMRIEDKLLSEGPWLHPRSYVTQGSAMVPVGFLGLPAILGIVWKFLGDWGLALFVPLLAISAAYPLFRLLQRFGNFAAGIAVLVWMSFPTVILYANRGLFPNLPALCFFLWGLYFLSFKKSMRWMIAAGLCTGAALAIRPTEIVWMLPWVWLVWQVHDVKKTKTRSTRQLVVAGIIAAVVPMLALSVVAWRTYGTPFAVGYLLHDAGGSQVVVSSLPPVASSAVGCSSLSCTFHSIWPFGVHPRDVWFNFQSYVLIFLGPWFVLMLCAFAAYVSKRRSWKVLAVSAWTLVVLAIVYGEAIYQDHVGVNVISSGNSYLRYLVPLAGLAALSAAALAAWLGARLGKNKSSVVMAAVVMVLMLLGAWTATSRDDENIFTTTLELQRYAHVRSVTLQDIRPQAIIVSDRSDKIFFPTFRVATPVPSFDLLRPLVTNAPIPTMLYATTLNQTQTAQWEAGGIGLQPIFNSENETLYQMLPTSTSTSP
ncbi:MAG: hypothetical protein WA001_03255 [Patescibacteria group bacterium]